MQPSHHPQTAELGHFHPIRFRFTGFGDNITSHPDKQDDYEGPFVGFLGAVEGERGGIGAGAVKISGSDEVLAPTFYLRVGPLADEHFRFELFPPSEVFGNTGWFRMGAGFNQGLDPGRHGFVGLGFGPYSHSESTEPLFIADIGWPLTPQVDLLTYGQVGKGKDRMQWSLGAGIAVNLGDRE